MKVFGGHVRRKRGEDRDNDYLQPGRLLRTNAADWTRAHMARPFYDHLDADRPFVYFPLHVTDDYKITRVIPHCVDQVSLVEQVADALPAGHDLVLKEHPMSVGRNSIPLLRRLRRRPNVRLVEPHDELARADPPGRGSGGDLLDGRPRGSALRQAGADARPALLLGLRGHGRRRLVHGDPEQGARAAALPARPGADLALPVCGDAALPSRSARPRRPVGGERGRAGREHRAGRREATEKRRFPAAV